MNISGESRLQEGITTVDASDQDDTEQISRTQIPRHVSPLIPSIMADQVVNNLLDPSTFIFPAPSTTVTIEFCDRVCSLQYHL